MGAMGRVAGLALSTGLMVGAAFGAARAQVTGDVASAAVWQRVDDGPSGVPMRAGILPPYAVLRFDKAAFDARMKGAGLESDRNSASVVIDLPMPDGTFERFRVKESPTLAPELAKAFPEIRTYAGQGIDDPAATTRFGWTEAGFHAIILTGTRGNMFIDTWAPAVLDVYLAYQDRAFAVSNRPDSD